MNPDVMAKRITQHETGLVAAGRGESWRWQLRDRNGQWIEMGARVKWMANGLARMGLVIGSPKEGEAEIEESTTKRHLRIPSSRLTVMTGEGGETVGDTTAPGTLKRAISSQPDPDTVPSPKTGKAALGAGETMPDAQVKRLSEGVNWDTPSSDDPDKDTFFKQSFQAIKNQRTPDGAVRPGSVDGTGTEEDPIYVGSDIPRAQELLLENKHIRMESRQDIASVLTPAFVEQMNKRGIEDLNMCLVSVAGTNVFCGDNQDITRDWMPQLGGTDKETGQTKDVQPWAEELYEQLGMIDPVEHVNAESLRASQSQLKTKQIIGMADAAEKYIDMTIAADSLRNSGKQSEADAILAERDRLAAQGSKGGVMSLDVLTEAILVTDDKYIIDGHHRWASVMLVNERLKVRGLEPLQMQVRRVRMEIGEALSTTNALATAAGIIRKPGGDVTPEEPRLLAESKPNPQVQQRLLEWAAELKKQLGPKAQDWKAISKAHKNLVRSRAMTAAASVQVGDILWLADDSYREVLRVVAETSGGRTFLQRDPYSGDLSLAILGSAASVAVLPA